MPSLLSQALPLPSLPRAAPDPPQRRQPRCFQKPLFAGPSKKNSRVPHPSTSPSCPRPCAPFPPPPQWPAQNPAASPIGFSPPVVVGVSAAASATSCGGHRWGHLSALALLLRIPMLTTAAGRAARHRKPGAQVLSPGPSSAKNAPPDLHFQ